MNALLRKFYVWLSKKIQHHGCIFSNVISNFKTSPNLAFVCTLRRHLNEYVFIFSFHPDLSPFKLHCEIDILTLLPPTLIIIPQTSSKSCGFIQMPFSWGKFCISQRLLLRAIVKENNMRYWRFFIRRNSLWDSAVYLKIQPRKVIWSQWNQSEIIYCLDPSKDKTIVVVLDLKAKNT